MKSTQMLEYIVITELVIVYFYSKSMFDSINHGSEAGQFKFLAISVPFAMLHS